MAIIITFLGLCAILGGMWLLYFLTVEQRGKTHTVIHLPERPAAFPYSHNHTAACKGTCSAHN